MTLKSMIKFNYPKILLWEIACKLNQNSISNFIRRIKKTRKAQPSIQVSSILFKAGIFELQNANVSDN